MSLMGAGMPSLDPPDELPCDSDACRFGPHSVPNGDGTSDWVFYDDGYNNIDKCGHCLIDFTRDAEQYTGLLWDCTVGKECQYSEENTMCNDANTFVYELVGKPCIQGIEIINENMNDYCGHKVGAKNCPKYVYGYCFPGNDGSWGCQPPLERNDWVMFSDYCSRCEFQEFENVCYKRYHPPTQNSVFTCTALENCRTSNDETRNFDNKDLFYDFGPGLEDPCPNGLRCCEKDDQIVLDPVYVDSPSVPSGQSGNCVIPSSLERPDGLVIEESDIPNALKTLGLCIYNDDTKDYAIVTGQDLITLYAKEISEDYSYTEANYQEEISKCDWGDISYNNMRNALVTSQKCCNGFDDLTSNWYQLIDGDLYINGEKCSDRSCPFVYSKTDEGYKLEEDIIVRQTESFMSNPFFTELEYYDLKENKLLIYEHLNELSYLDQIQLVAVKHNYDAVVDVLGNFYTINNPQKVECVDDIGRDCTKMLEKEDAKIKTKSRVRIPSRSSYDL